MLASTNVKFMTMPMSHFQKHVPPQDGVYPILMLHTSQVYYANNTAYLISYKNIPRT